MSIWDINPAVRNEITVEENRMELRVKYFNPEFMLILALLSEFPTLGVYWRWG